MDALKLTEAKKYTKVWELEDYRANSPGLRILDTFITKCQPSGSIIDLGCGSGRASLELFKRGLDVLMLDIASNCLNTDVVDMVCRHGLWDKFAFVQACLWDIPDWLLQRDWVYCCDVMEHIPPERVDDVLAAAAKLCKEGAFFQIACFQDIFGKLVGEHLHLTVNPPAWWKQKLQQHFNIIDDLSSEMYGIFHVGPL